LQCCGLQFNQELFIGIELLIAVDVKWLHEATSSLGDVAVLSPDVLLGRLQVTTTISTLIGALLLRIGFA
jgi:hypothetical protein